jgi:gallate decarboxylase subunit D
MTAPSTRFAVRTDAPDWVVEAEAMRVGEDLLVCIFGGERPHIGAVAAAQPRPSLADPARTSATASVLAFVGHKEDDVAKHAAERLAAMLGVRVVVTAGIHWDNLDAEGIVTIRRRCDEILDKLVARLGPA